VFDSFWLSPLASTSKLDRVLKCPDLSFSKSEARLLLELSSTLASLTIHVRHLPWILISIIVAMIEHRALSRASMRHIFAFLLFGRRSRLVHIDSLLLAFAAIVPSAPRARRRRSSDAGMLARSCATFMVCGHLVAMHGDEQHLHVHSGGASRTYFPGNRVCMI
jgi:hypothetical protein